jgi:hypothetical protein
MFGIYEIIEVYFRITLKISECSRTLRSWVFNKKPLASFLNFFSELEIDLSCDPETPVYSTHL